MLVQGNLDAEELIGTSGCWCLDVSLCFSLWSLGRTVLVLSKLRAMGGDANTFPLQEPRLPVAGQVARVMLQFHLNY